MVSLSNRERSPFDRLRMSGFFEIYYVVVYRSMFHAGNIFSVCTIACNKLLL